MSPLTSALLLVVLLCGGAFAATCANPETVEPFDLKAYMGQW